ncbi:MAG: DegT/DnrJ/EryC1/StrS aminotransferase family protein [Roseitalea sp.]|jgi:dTDP-4-amino-4,6-dideoxygalactose transaminase|nr:DegT/DnrJ/EryC1/StrS aminotransferase family protein [Roseitalea sp.]MBO6723458.1 DegT/DnrJ/EryC1/StrS aminotransferase family protein [Roseitalea sp.]MBO6742478.1 DegT/DnrJ/EryC1/StrS aminotransferase family protein [Roseitalea sp.]
MQFIDLAAQRARLGPALDEAVSAAVHGGAYILGPQVAEFEKRFADYLGVKHVIGCASGTDALQIPLMAWGVGQGDAVFVPSFTFASTAEVVALLGAEPVFVDIDPETYLMDVRSLESAISMIKAEGRLTPRAIIPVDLFGMVADYDAIMPVARAHGLTVISDAAQAAGAMKNGGFCGAFGDVATTSFYPAKPLGCYGDGGAVMTDDDDLAEVMRSVAFHGKGESQYDNVRIGLTSRLDTIQAAVLNLKLDILEDEMDARQRVAQRYHDGLKDVVKTARNPDGMRSAWAQYAIESADRDALKAHLAAKDIPSVIYYVKPLHLQTVYDRFPVAPGGLPVTEAKPATILCLPMHPYLAEADQDRVIAEIRAFAGRSALPVAAE